MSIENEKTIEVYEKKASVYLNTTIEHDNLDLEKARCKKEKLEEFIETNLEILPKGAKILEIGAGDGNNSKYIEELGYNVTASDVAEDFIKAIKAKGLKTIKFNLLKDTLSEKYSAIFCWRVFVHFTKEDIKIALQKVYEMLEDEGLFIFNVMNLEGKTASEEWVDFDNEYHMGAKRYYKYFSEKELYEIIIKSGFTICNFHKEGGESNNKWLVYVLKK